MKDEIARLKKLIERDPRSTLFLRLAEEYRGCGQLDEALEVLRQGLKNHPHYATARVALGRVLLEKSMIAEAREELERVLDTAPDNIAARRMLVDIHSRAGRYDLAAEQEEVIRRLSPKSSRGKREPISPSAEPSSIEESRPGRDETSTAASDSTVRREDVLSGLPDLAGVEIATTSMADVYIAQDLYDEALVVLEKLLERSPDDSSIRQRVADLKMLMKLHRGRAERGPVTS